MTRHVYSVLLHIVYVVFHFSPLQSVDPGGPYLVFPWPPLIACQIVFATATAAMRGPWGPCACWWEGQRPPPLWATSTPAPLPLLSPAEPQKWLMVWEASLSFLQEAPSTPAARTWTPHTSTASTLKGTPTLMHLTAEDLHFSCDKKESRIVWKFSAKSLCWCSFIT